MIQPISSNVHRPQPAPQPVREAPDAAPRRDVVEIPAGLGATETPRDVAQFARDTRQLLSDLTLEKSQSSEHVTVGELLNSLRTRQIDRLLLG